MEYSIQTVSKHFSIPASTLRYYEKEGILPPLKRKSGEIRSFTEEDMLLIQVILCLKKTGMPNKEIKEFMTLYCQGDSTIQQRQFLFDQHRQAIQNQICHLQDNLAVLERKMLTLNKPKLEK